MPRRTAIIVDWMRTFTGAERTLAEVLRLVPDADIHGIADGLRGGDRAFLAGRRVRTSFIQRLPFGPSRTPAWLPFIPLAIEGLDLAGYDLVLSMSHAVAHGALAPPAAVHLCYCHSPMRWAWDQRESYLRGLGPLAWPARWQLQRMRRWDQQAGARPDRIAANSRHVAARIARCWRRRAEVIHPPVAVERFAPAAAKDGYYITVSRLVPYKRIDLVVSAFAGTGRRLLVVGDGSERRRVAAAARGSPGIELLGQRDDAEVARLLAGARAFVFAAEEDFGIAPVEALASGTPVIALGRGGVLDSVADGSTGLFFPAQDAAAIRAAVDRFEADPGRFDPRACRAAAEAFRPEAFRGRLGAWIEAAMAAPREELMR